MISIALGVFIVFIMYVMIWSLKNDDVRSIREQTGFIKMRDSSKSTRKLGQGRFPRHETDPKSPNGADGGPEQSPPSRRLQGSNKPVDR